MGSSPEASGALTGFLRQLGAVGVIEQPGTSAQSSLCAVFDEALDRDELVARVRAYVSELAARGIDVRGKVRVHPLVADGWAEAWPEYFVPVAVGRRLLIAPPWITPRADDRVVIVIDPGRGFGTGNHATTAGCLAMLEPIVERERPRSAIDLGTGSGLLAIAAARLGVARVLAVDDDPEAIASAVANAARNGVADRVSCVVADAGAVETEPAPLVMANLLTAVHVRLAPRYARLVTPAGVVVLGGILETEAPELIATIGREGLRPREQVTIDGWTTLALRCHEGPRMAPPTLPRSERHGFPGALLDPEERMDANATTWRPRRTVGQMVDEAKTRIENLSVADLETEMSRGGVQVLDIRDVRERRKLGFIPGSTHVPRGMLEFWLDPTSHYYAGKVDPTKRIIVYCAGGQRSALAADVLREMGFPSVAHLEVGFNGWVAAGRSVDREPEARS